MAKLFALVALVILAQSVEAGECDDEQAAYNNAVTALSISKQGLSDARAALKAAQEDSSYTGPPSISTLQTRVIQWSQNVIAARQLKTTTKKALDECNGCPGRRLADGRRLQSTCGDPITSFKGVKTRYWLSMEHFTPMLTQGPFVVSQLAGPANPPPGLEAHKGAWVVATEVDMAGLDKIHIETVDPTLLLVHPNATVPPATVDALTTMRLSVGGKQLAAGEHTLSMADSTVAVSAKRDPNTRRIGIGWVEQITITADGLELRITSAKANKFADEEHQVLGLHLDVEFLTFDESAVRGALPEMWGLQPMSEDTKLLLGEKNVEN